MSRSNRVTLATISRELNISTSSVSRALRNDPLIHPETRAKVSTIAARLGYQGRSRRGPQNTAGRRSISVLFAGNSLTDIKNSVITMSYLQGMTSEIEATNTLLNVHVVPMEGTVKKSGKNGVATATHGEGDVVIIIGRHDSDFVTKLSQGFPVVSLVRAYEGVKHDLVSTDDVSGVSQLVKKLADLGHRKLAWASFEDRSSYSHSRRAGFLEGCVSSGLDLSRQELIHSMFVDWTLKHPEYILQALKKGVTAFVAASDHAAYEISRILTENKISMPGDVSLTGFDAIGEPGFQSLSFTTYDPNFVEMGRVAIRLALSRLENLSAAPLNVTVRGRLIEGSTTGPVSGRRAKA